MRGIESKPRTVALKKDSKNSDNKWQAPAQNLNPGRNRGDLSKYLTKSKFTTGCECPTKLYFGAHKEYGSKKLDDAFLQALAKGGFQVGALAQVYHPGGVQVEAMDHAKALEVTAKLMERDQVTIFEAAFHYEGLFIRVDVLKKIGKKLEIIEVKAKSINFQEHETFYDKRKLKAKKSSKIVVSKWKPYLLDVAFQTYVLNKCLPDHEIQSFLMLANTATVASVDGLNQMFLIGKDENDRTHIKIAAGTDKSKIGNEILSKICVDDEVKTLFASEIQEGILFTEFVSMLKNGVIGDQKVSTDINSDCKSCEFRISVAEKSLGKRSGFDECWAPIFKASNSSLDRPLSFDVWYFNADKAMEEGKYFVDQLEESDFTTPSRKERQWLQVLKSKTKDTSPDIKANDLAEEMTKWTYPLHFIDFETSRVAIPFNQGRRPYEQIAFQFSHHTMQVDGKVQHKNQFISSERGKFPNFEFVRALKNALSEDKGTIFRFHTHENTVLREIRIQLLEAHTPESDRDDLVAWIQSITNPSDDHDEKWICERPMVDLHRLVQNYYYHPQSNGSNSIKNVLPAILQASQYLQDKYSKPTYGAPGGIPSFNFRNHIWIKAGSENANNPYKSLPAVFEEIEFEKIDMISDLDELRDGGAAMTAYAHMQFTEMKDLERDRLSQALLKYCELDTLAMVMIYECWREELRKLGKLPKAA
jgi:hypothetical protein